MTLNIKHPLAEQLARTLAQRTGESITEVVIKALRERLLHEEGIETPALLVEELMAISHRCSALPDQDIRPANEILGYDQHGLPE